MAPMGSILLMSRLARAVPKRRRGQYRSPRATTDRSSSPPAFTGGSLWGDVSLVAGPRKSRSSPFDRGLHLSGQDHEHLAARGRRDIRDDPHEQLGRSRRARISRSSVDRNRSKRRVGLSLDLLERKRDPLRLDTSVIAGREIDATGASWRLVVLGEGELAV